MFAGFRFDPGGGGSGASSTARASWRRSTPTRWRWRARGRDPRRARGGRVALFLGVEGSYAIDDDVEAGVARLAEAGVMFLGPLWERDSDAGSSCRTAAARIAGSPTRAARWFAPATRPGSASTSRTPAGRPSGISSNGRRRPPFSSHSGAAGAYPHPRNLDDDQIRALAARGGIVGVIFVAPYLGGTFCTLERVADHIEHVAGVGGEDCVALGSDFDGFLPLPRGLRDAADLPRLTEILWRRGWRGARLAKLLGENALRFFAATDA